MPSILSWVLLALDLNRPPLIVLYSCHGAYYPFEVGSIACQILWLFLYSLDWHDH